MQSSGQVSMSSRAAAAERTGHDDTKQSFAKREMTCAKRSFWKVPTPFLEGQLERKGKAGGGARSFTPAARRRGLPQCGAAGGGNVVNRRSEIAHIRASLRRRRRARAPLALARPHAHLSLASRSHTLSLYTLDNGLMNDVHEQQQQQRLRWLARDVPSMRCSRELCPLPVVHDPARAWLSVAPLRWSSRRHRARRPAGGGSRPSPASSPEREVGEGWGASGGRWGGGACRRTGTRHGAGALPLHRPRVPSCRNPTPTATARARGGRGRELARREQARAGESRRARSSGQTADGTPRAASAPLR
jgi:hypothetical protein